MKEKFDLTASIVLYKNDRSLLTRAINSFLNTGLRVKLYLIDNSPSDELSHIVGDRRVDYIFNRCNLGFGKAHNIALKKATLSSNYHLVLNPDVFFHGGSIEKLFVYMENNLDVGQVMPKVLYPNGKLQYLCKLLPTPFDLIFRRFFGKLSLTAKRNELYELRVSGYNKFMNVPYLSGCFMFLRCSCLKEVGYFDENIFMYIEDADLTRRIHRTYKTMFNPEVVIYHHYAKGSYKSLKLMFYNIHGAVVYFNKYGWFWDQERKEINSKLLKEINE